MTTNAEEEVRRDSLGRRIHSSRRGPVPVDVHERSTVLLQARIPRPLYEEVLKRAEDHPGAGRRKNGSGRSGVVVEALTVLFHGDAQEWYRKYRREAAARGRAEARALEADTRLIAQRQRAENAEAALRRAQETIQKMRRLAGG